MTPRELARRESELTPFGSFGRVFDDFFGRNWMRMDDGGANQLLAPALDIAEDEHAFVVSTELPGLSKDEVQIQFENGVLSISGEKKHESEQKDRTWHRMERRYGTFYRSITLPAGVEAERAEARFENGVLTVSIPKREEAKPKSIKIK